jgi:Rps23 Pro-64 3,4-dihydroxylase Tpa1-like proline 4-hydroxylase
MTASDIAPVLNPGLDADALSKDFARQGRLHIRNLLTSDSASRLHRCLEQETDYSVAIMTEQGAQYAKPAALAQPDLMRQVQIGAYNRAHDGQFSFLYDVHIVTQTGAAYPAANHYLRAVTDFLEGEAFLGLCRAVTGLDGIAFADAQATRYRPGHFLTQHDDNVPEQKRLAAYVLNLTPRWRPEWGGLLLFLDGEGHVDQGFTPAFNALNIFTVPQRHIVTQVAPFAGGPRLSITGWLRSR